MEVDNEYKHCTFYDKCMAKDVAADALAEEWTGYVVWICDENDLLPECSCCWVKVILVVGQGELEKESISLFMDAL